MVKCQSVNLPPWKITTWFPRVIEILKNINNKLRDVEDGGFPESTFLPSLAKHWEELNEENASSDDEGAENAVGTFQGVYFAIQG